MDEALARANCQKLEKRKLMRKHLNEKVSKHKTKLYETGTPKHTFNQKLMMNNDGMVRQKELLDHLRKVYGHIRVDYIHYLGVVKILRQ